MIPRDRTIYQPNVPSGNPPTGFYYLYIDGGTIKLKDDSGAVTIMGDVSSGASNTLVDGDGNTINTINAPTALQEGGTNIHEQGTWTPAIEFGGGSTGITYDRQIGRYFRTEDMINVWLHIFLTDKGSSTGSAKIVGLPFTILSVTGFFTAVQTHSHDLSTNIDVVLQVGWQSTQLDLREAATDTDVTASDFTNSTQVKAEFSFIRS